MNRSQRRDLKLGAVIVAGLVLFALAVAATHALLLEDRRPKALAIPPPAPSASVDQVSDPQERPKPPGYSGTPRKGSEAPDTSGAWQSSSPDLAAGTVDNIPQPPLDLVTPIRSAVENMTEGLATSLSPVYAPLDESTPILGDIP